MAEKGDTESTDCFDSTFEIVDEKQVEEFWKDVSRLSSEELYEKLRRELNDWESQQVNIGVVGQAKQGKSSLINAFMGYFIDENGDLPDEAAKVDESEVCTTEPKRYSHPDNENVVLWDLPGVDGNKHSIDRYLEIIRAKKPKAAQGDQKEFIDYDFFLVLTKDVIGTDAKFLSQFATSSDKKFFVVRTQIDNTIREGAKRKRSESVVKIRTSKSIENECQQSGIQQSGIYLVDCYSTSTHDFAKLQSDILKYCPAVKREALMMTLHGQGGELIKQKKTLLASRMLKVSLQCASASIPFSEKLLMPAKSSFTREMFHYLRAFRLFPSDISRLEIEHGFEANELESFVVKELRKQNCDSLEKARCISSDLGHNSESSEFEAAANQMIRNAAAVGGAGVGALLADKLKATDVEMLLVAGVVATGVSLVAGGYAWRQWYCLLNEALNSAANAALALNDYTSNERRWNNQ